LKNIYEFRKTVHTHGKGRRVLIPSLDTRRWTTPRRKRMQACDSSRRRRKKKKKARRLFAYRRLHLRDLRFLI
jgi:hypothetical protein